MSQATSPSAKKTYGIQRVCRTWKLSRATVQRRKAAEGATAPVPTLRLGCASSPPRTQGATTTHQLS